jgi:mRNA-degrading endonuclease RelE of RelBE toxin-antitoxin system
MLVRQMYTLIYREGWNKHYAKMDKTTQSQIWKKIQKQINETKTRHMRQGLDFFVVEAGQNRIVLKINEQLKTKTIYFIGNHKQYEDWYYSLMRK